MTEEEKRIIESADVSFWHCPKCNSNDVRMRFYEKSFAKELVGWTVLGVLGSLLSLRGTGWYVFCNNCGNKFTTTGADAHKKKIEGQMK